MSSSVKDVNIYTLDMSRRQAVAAAALYAVALVASIVVAVQTDQPGLWGIVPVVVYAGLALLGVDMVLATLGAVVSAVVLTRSTPAELGPVLLESMGSLVALLGVIILLGAGLGEVLKRTGVAEFIVLSVVRGVGLTTQLRAQFGVMVACTVLAGALGTLAGSVAIVAPIVIPLLAALGFSTTATAAMFFFSGLAGLTLSPFAPITASIYGAAGVSWIGYVLAAGLPVAAVMFGVGFLSVRWNQRRTAQAFPYPPERAVDLDDVHDPAPGARRTTAAFLVAFAALVVYSGVTAAGATFVPVALILLIAVAGLAARRSIGELMGAVYAGASRLLGIFFLFFLLAVLFTLVDSMGVYDGVAERFALSSLGPYLFCLVVVLIGWVGVAGAAAAQAVLVNQVFGPLAVTLGVPPAAWSLVLLAGAQTDGLGPFPNPDMIGQMGLAESRSLRWQLLSSYLVLVPVVVVYAVLLAVYL